MNKEKAPEEVAEDAEPATVPMLTGKNFEESIKTGIHHCHHFHIEEQ